MDRVLTIVKTVSAKVLTGVGSDKICGRHIC